MKCFNFPIQTVCPCQKHILTGLRSNVTLGELDKGMDKLQSGFPHINFPIEQCSELTQAARNTRIREEILREGKRKYLLGCIVKWNTYFALCWRKIIKFETSPGTSKAQHTKPTLQFDLFFLREELYLPVPTGVGEHFKQIKIDCRADSAASYSSKYLELL